MGPPPTTSASSPAFIELGFVEAISMLLPEGTPIYTYPRVLGHELAGEVVEVPENARGLRPGIDAPSNRISVAANAALAKWDERTAANSCGCSVYMSMEACRDFWASRLSYSTNQTCCRLINSRLSRRWELELMPLKEASGGLWSSDEKN